MALYATNQGILTIEKGEVTTVDAQGVKTNQVIVPHGLTKPPVRVTLQYSDPTKGAEHATCVVQLRRMPIQHNSTYKHADDAQRSKASDAMHIGREDAELVLALTAFDAQTCTFDVTKNTLAGNVDIVWYATAKDVGQTQAQPALAAQPSGTRPGATA